MTLSKRLLCVASFVPEGSFIADVGSDHAQIPLFLLQNHRIRGAEAIENKKGPFKRMSSAVLSSPYKENIVLSLSDGISILDHRVDAVVLAGMGGRLIQKILQEHPENLRQVKSLIIDAHSERDVLFAFLGEKGFRISQESFFYDEGIPYDVIQAIQEENPVVYSWKECHFGPLNLKQKSPDFIAYWSKELERMSSLIAAGKLSGKNESVYQQEVSAIKEVLQ
jgi:Predicted SAM-dependent methyltransferase